MNISPPIPAPSPAVAQPPQQAPTQPQPQPQSQEPAPPVPLSEYDQLLASLKEHPHSSENWNRLIDVAEQSKDMEKIKTAYESLLQIYPNTSAAQIAYLKHYTTKYDAASLKTAQTLFKPWLLNSASVDLLRFYVDYVRRAFRLFRSDPKTMRQCYDFAVNAVGHDKDAGEIWSEYIKFIHNGPTDGPPGAAEGAAQAATRINDLRKLYRRAVQIPLMNVEKLWQDYVRFETETSKQTVKDMLQSQLSSYTTAKLKLKELRDHLGPLYPTLTAAPGHRVPFNLPSPPTFIPGEKNLRDRWLHYLNWEESNPLMLEIQTKEGGKEFVSRLKGIYKNAVVKMRFYGEIWFRWFTWFNDLEKDKRLDKENPLDILIAGIEANPTSFLLNYALAEQYEIQQKYDEVNKTYNTFLEALQKELDEIEARLPPPSENGADDQPSSQGSDKSKPDGKEKDPERELFQRRIREMGSAWCMYMRFARRSQDQVASRKVFAQARKAKHLDWRVFDYAALTEYHLTKAANIATNIYESGLKRHPTDVEFICQYLQFLININDESNARSLFERVITNPILTPEKARPIWEKWSTYEFNFGDLAASQKMEKRMLEIYTVGACYSISFRTRDLNVVLCIRPSNEAFRHATQAPHGCHCYQRSWIFTQREPASPSSGTRSLTNRHKCTRGTGWFWSICSSKSTATPPASTSPSSSLA
ncbi:hypothetical protein SISSUDRAFT_985867 [Sistotremastrum suecicum HHB10207 ss-3]|uniref:mRNA 3'-end-processing protein RNA14 n=1 Tax=Sistotremastrum suecicum HHB10207 ss-3 TaxID=1314776 RepID=A0A166DN53_9AGAM|nr:hypothetical protein SISSUDRAFT_985867 [Sistotremastrum suecicum HHB10207 ss-3]